MLKILSVEDDENDFQILRDQLRAVELDHDCGMIFVENATSLTAARERMQLEKYDVVFADYNLGSENSVPFIRQLINSPEHPPIILLTGMPVLALDAELIHWVSSGELSILHKDNIDTQVLTERLQHMLHNLFHILVLDDEPDDFVLIREHLNLTSKKKFKTTWASTFDEAVELVADPNNHFDAFIVDYRLPTHSGLEFVHSLMRMKMNKPVVLISSQEAVDVDSSTLELISSRKLYFLPKMEISTHSLIKTLESAHIPDPLH